jgi:hypothetical protein
MTTMQPDSANTIKEKKRADSFILLIKINYSGSATAKVTLLMSARAKTSSTLMTLS